METIQANVTGRKPGSRKPGSTAVSCHARESEIDPDELIENAEAAKLLRLKPQSLAVWRTEKRGPRHLKVGRRVLYRRRDICAWLATQLSGETA